MWKKAVVGAAALMIAGSMMVYAQQRSGGPGGLGGFGGPGGWRPSVEDMSAFADARIAALHAGLKLTADQEKNWPAFEQALRELSKIRMERLAAVRTARDEQTPASPIERLQRRADAMMTRGTALKRLADTAAPLYQSLDEAQKHRFTMLVRFMRPRPHHAMWRGHFGGGQFGGSGGFGGPGGMRGGEGFQFGPRRFGDDGGMRRQRGMRGGQEEDDYRGPL